MGSMGSFDFRLRTVIKLRALGVQIVQVQSKNDFRPSLRNRLRSARHTLRKSGVTKKKASISPKIASRGLGVCGLGVCGRKSGAATSRGGENLVSSTVHPSEGGCENHFCSALVYSSIKERNTTLAPRLTLAPPLIRRRSRLPRATACRLPTAEKTRPLEPTEPAVYERTGHQIGPRWPHTRGAGSWQPCSCANHIDCGRGHAYSVATGFISARQEHEAVDRVCGSLSCFLGVRDESVTDQTHCRLEAHGAVEKKADPQRR